MEAFDRKITTTELFLRVMTGARAYAQKSKSNPDLRLKYGQGWINSERWLDASAPSPSQQEPPRLMFR
jgi:hypothetical protein